MSSLCSLQLCTQIGTLATWINTWKYAFVLDRYMRDMDKQLDTFIRFHWLMQFATLSFIQQALDTGMIASM